jgi:hypothetical protein
MPLTLWEARGELAGKVREAAPSLYSSTYENPMLGAEQQTVPHPERYGEPLSNKLFVSDSGEVSFQDKNGDIVPTDRSKHVFLRGPDGPAVYSRSEATRESPIEGASRVLSLGLGGANAPTTARAVAQTAPVAEATIPKLREAATAVYEDPAIRARPVDAQAVNDAFTKIAPQLKNFDTRVIDRLHGELSDIPPTIGGLNTASERLGVIAGETVGPVGSQKGTPAAAAAQIVKQKIDEVMRTVAPEWAVADKNYNAAEAARTIINRGDLATVRARGGDFAEKMGQQATTLLANPKLTRGFLPDELDQLRAISEGRLQGDKLRSAAEWMTGKLALLGPAAAGLIGYEHSGVATALGGMVGTAALEGLINRFLGGSGNRAAAAQVNNLVANIRARSPLGQQLAQSAADWTTAQRALMSSPNNYTLTALARSSRDLSNALGSVGVKIRPNELMRVESPSPSQAGQDQQQIPRPVR